MFRDLIPELSIEELRCRFLGVVEGEETVDEVAGGGGGGGGGGEGLPAGASNGSRGGSLFWLWI